MYRWWFKRVLVTGLLRQAYKSKVNELLDSWLCSKQIVTTLTLALEKPIFTHLHNVSDDSNRKWKHIGGIAANQPEMASCGENKLSMLSVILETNLMDQINSEPNHVFQCKKNSMAHSTISCHMGI